MSRLLRPAAVAGVGASVAAVALGWGRGVLGVTASVRRQGPSDLALVRREPPTRITPDEPVA